MASRTVTISCRSFHDMDNKVRAIKGARMVTNIGLKEAKELVELVTPGHAEVIQVPHDILEPKFSEGVQLIKDSGLTVSVGHPNIAVRKGIATDIRRLITFCTVSAQYDIAKALLDVMETYCPDPEEDFDEKDQ